MQELEDALAQPLQPGFSTKYFTGRAAADGAEPAGGEPAAAGDSASAMVALAARVAEHRKAASVANANKVPLPLSRTVFNAAPLWVGAALARS